MARIQPFAAAALLATAFAASDLAAQPYGIDTREENTSILINNLPPAPGTFSIANAYSMSFTNPLYLTAYPDGSNRAYVVQKNGLIRVFDQDDASPSATTYLNISGLVSTGSEQGLLSMAFHPNYAANGYFFVYYTNTAGHTVVARYTRAVGDPTGNTADPASAVTFLTQNQPFSNHNGGQLQFGHDGYLYIGLGDGGSGNDPNDDAQRMTTFLGKMLRIDVNTPDAGAGTLYSIPPDNPFQFAAAPNVIIESRNASGSINSTAYQEFGSGWIDSPLKSSVAGLTGTGSRLSDNSVLNARARYTPNLVEGLYNVYVTVPNNAAANAANSVYTIVNAGETMTFTVPLTQSAAGNQWLRIRRNVPFATGTTGYLEVAESSPQSGSFFADAVRFERVTGIRPEIYAFGLRNPWRFSPDLVDGRMWIGDVGQSTREEVNILEAGANYGWREVEGDVCTPGVNGGVCDITGTTRPIITYNRSSGRCSITGGFVYRGSRVPSLYGHYIYGDYCSTQVFAYNLATGATPTLLASAGSNILGFGQDESGEVFILCSDGSLKQLNPTVAPPPSDLPLRLSDLPPLYDIAKDIPVTGIIPYEPNVQFWSDGAIKTRWVAIPGIQQATWQQYDGWSFPNGTTIVKNFRMPLVGDTSGNPSLIETRLLIRNAGEWRGFTYWWDDAENDGLLVTGGATRNLLVDTNEGPLALQWHYFTNNECLQCHTVNTNRVLGLSTYQMNSDYEYPESGVTDNQLRTLDHIDLFADPGLPGAPETLVSMPDWTDTSADLTDRVKAYFQANCSMCHRVPGGTAPTPIDFRYQTPLQDMYLVDAEPLAGNLGLPDAKIVYPGDPGRSVLYSRITTLNTQFRMPPLGSHRVDEEGAELIRLWILSLGPASAGSSWMMY